MTNNTVESAQNNEEPQIIGVPLSKVARMNLDKLEKRHKDNPLCTAVDKVLDKNEEVQQ